jgi:hypothetical protein
MKSLMTKHFSKWASKQKISVNELTRALAELKAGSFEANLGSHIYKKEFGLRGKAKVAVEEQLFAIKREIEPFSFMDSPKTRNRICLGKNSMPSKSYQKFYLDYQQQK